MSTSIIPHSPTDLATADNLHDAFALMAYGLSEGSKRQYRHTFDLWADWTRQAGVGAHDLSARHVIAFLSSFDIARKTKMARLTHLRRLAQTLHAGDVGNPALRQNYEQLKLLSLPTDDTGGQPRERKALAPDQVHDALRFWPDDTNSGRRNRALLAVLFYAGLRRSEAVAMQWSHIDFERGLLTLPHRKNHSDDASDVIPFANWPRAKRLLQDWRRAIPGYDYVFVPIDKGDNIGADKPLPTESVRRICKQSGDFKPHDARRTLLTNLLTSGTTLPDAQFIAGHSQGSTTMHYAIVKDANEVKGRVKLNY